MEPRSVAGCLIMVGILGILICIGMVLFKAGSDETGEISGPPGEIIIPDEAMGYVKTFRIITPERAMVGEDVSILVVAMDKSGSVVSDYTGVITIKSELIDLPEKSRFMAGDVGRLQLKAKAINAGTEVVEIIDPVSGIKAESEPIIIEENLSE